MVAFRWTENSTPSALARAIWRSRKARSAATCMTVASTTSPASTGIGARSTVVVPSAATSSTRSDAVRRHHRRALVGAEVAAVHVGHVGLRVRRPGAHAVGVGPGVVLDRGRGPTVRVALAQHRVDGAARDLAVAGQRVARPRRSSGPRGSRGGRSPWPAARRWPPSAGAPTPRCSGSLMMLASGVSTSRPSSARASPTRWSARRSFGEAGQDAPGQRDVPGHHRRRRPGRRRPAPPGAASTWPAAGPRRCACR